MATRAFIVLITAAALANAASCVGDSSSVPDSGPDSTIPTGSLGGPCFTNGTCDTGLTCVLQAGTGVCEPVDAPVEASTDASPDVTADAPSEAGEASVVYAYSDISDPSKWAAFDLSTVNSSIGGFAGAAFDGRYVYFVPKSQPVPQSIAARYDTTAAFGTSSSWQVYDMSALDAGAAGFTGAAYDGRFVYFAPQANGAPDGVVARFDTQMDAGLAAPSAWGTFDTTNVDSGAAGFAGAVFDGTYVYFVPLANAGGGDGLVTRFNTKGAGFLAKSSWETFDVSALSSTAIGFVGGVFDGRYVYLVPNYNGNPVRYDTTKPFGTAGSWDWVSLPFSMSNDNWGGVFDGRFVYDVPTAHAGGPSGDVTRVDTQSDAGFDASFTGFDTTGINMSAEAYYGGAFDGRYVYFVPHGGNGAPGNVLARYDTENDGGASAGFGLASSWGVLDMSTLDGGASARGFHGAAFDGRYLYFVPDGQAVVWRFDAKTPAALPAGTAHGSFL